MEGKGSLKVEVDRRLFLKKTCLGAFSGFFGSLSFWNFLYQRPPEVVSGVRKYHVFKEKSVDYNWAKEQCRYIVNSCSSVRGPVYSSSLRQSVFSQDYQSFIFHKSSELPIVKMFVDFIEKEKSSFYRFFPEHKWGFEFVYLTYVQDASKDYSSKIIDSVFFNGTWHMTIQGHSHIEVFPYQSEKSELLYFNPGTLWFHNGGAFPHRIKPTPHPTERFEMIAMWNLAPEVAEHQRKRVVNDRLKSVQLTEDERHIRSRLFYELQKKSSV